MNSKHEIGWQLPSRCLNHTASDAAPRNMLLLVLLIDEFKGRAKCLFSQKSLVDNDNLCETQDNKELRFTPEEAALSLTL